MPRVDSADFLTGSLFMLMYATLSSATAEATAGFGSDTQLPQPQPWDKAAFMVVAFLQYTRLLLPLVILSFGFLVTFSGILTVMIFLGRDYLLPLKFVTTFCMLGLEIFRQLTAKRNAVRNWLRSRLGDRYVGLLTHALKLRETLSITYGGRTWSIWDKLVVIAALTSWQEWLCCATLAAWALVAFTPELLTQGGGWPLEGMASWMLMQLDLIWGTLWKSLGQVCAFCPFGWYCCFRWYEWMQRRKDLLALASLRKIMASPTGAPQGLTIPAHLRLQPGDSTETEELKNARLTLIWSKLALRQTLAERLAVPWPTTESLLLLLCFSYGILIAFVGVGPLQPDPDHALHPVVFWPVLAALGWWYDLRRRDPVAWVVTAFAAFFVSGIAKLITNAKRQEWAKTYAMGMQMGLMFSDADAAESNAYKFAEANHGPYPSTVKRLGGWAWAVGRFVIVIAYGCAVTRCFIHVEYLPTYGLPAYGTLYGQMYCGARCIDAKKWVALGGGLQYRGLVDEAASAVSPVDNAWTGWMQDLRTAARLNALAAQLWRKGGLRGMHLGMEALLATVSPDALASRSARKRAQEALRELQLYGHFLRAAWDEGEVFFQGQHPKAVWDRLLTGVVRTDDVRRGPRASRASTAGSSSHRADRNDPTGGEAGRSAAGPSSRTERRESARQLDRPPSGSRASSSASGQPRTEKRTDAGFDDRKPPQAPSREEDHPSPVKRPPSYDVMDYIDIIGTCCYLAVAAVLAAWLVVMRPKWLSEPGKVLDAVIGLSCDTRSAARARRAPAGRKKGDSSSSSSKATGGKKHLQSPSPPQHQQLARSNTGSAAGGSRTAATSGPTKSGIAAKTSKPAAGKATAAAFKQANPQPHPQVTSKESSAVAPSSAPSTAGLRRRNGQLAGSASSSSSRTAQPTEKTLLAQTRLGNAEVGTSSGSPLAAALAGILPFTSSLVRQPPAAETPVTPATAASISPKTCDAHATAAASAAAASVAIPKVAAAAVLPAAPATPPHAAAAAAGAPLQQTSATVAARTVAAGSVLAPTRLPASSGSLPQPSSAQPPLWSSIVAGGRATPTLASDAAASTAAAPSAAPPVATSSTGGQLHVPVPVPVPIPTPAASPPFVDIAGQHVQLQQPVKPSLPVSAPRGYLVGLNPALVRGLAALGRSVPAASAASGGVQVSGPTGPVPPPRGGLWGNAPGLHPEYCASCQAQRRSGGAPESEWGKREMCVMHGFTVHLSLCRGCAAGFELGSPCPVCGEPVEQLLNIDISKLKW